MLTDERTAQLKEYVERGANWMDKKKPDWFKKIRNLKMSHCNTCVMGQSHLRFLDVINKDFVKLLPEPIAGFTYDQAFRLAATYGFCVDINDLQVGNCTWVTEELETWKTLEDFWNQQIQQRMTTNS